MPIHPKEYRLETLVGKEEKRVSMCVCVRTYDSVCTGQMGRRQISQ